MDIQCPCGAVQLRISSAPVAQFWCHCADCRRVHNAAYVGESLYPAESVAVLSGETIAFTLRTTPRVSCARCGSRLFADLTDLGMRGVSGTLLPEEAFDPQLHIHCREAVAPVRDGLPHYQTRPVAFGGEDDAVMAW